VTWLTSITVTNYAMTDIPADKRRLPKPATDSRLHNIALHYLERYAASSESLRRVLLRRVSKSVYYHDTDPQEGAGFVEDIIKRFQDSGLLDDNIYAEGQVQSLFRRGLSRRAIYNRLMEKGVGQDIIERHLEQLKQSFPDPDLNAAFAFARRRRLGPFRDPENRADRRQRDLASLARGGFDFQTATKIIDAEDAFELEEMIRNDA
jgi:regulatory protein